jgi:hypothetical protein
MAARTSGQLQAVGLLLAAMLLGAGIFYVRATHPRMPGSGPSLSQATVLRLAQDAIAREHIDLSQYDPPKISRSFQQAHWLWFVTYSEKQPDLPAPPSMIYLAVIVDDATQVATLSPTA